jgi:hypothetical protein
MCGGRSGAQRAARTQLCLACWPLEWSVALYLLPWCSVCVYPPCTDSGLLTAICMWGSGMDEG